MFHTNAILHYIIKHDISLYKCSVTSITLYKSTIYDFAMSQTWYIIISAYNNIIDLWIAYDLGILSLGHTMHHGISL